MTYTLPLREWYTDTTNHWTLDYPPLFAYFEALLGHAAHALGVDEATQLTAKNPRTPRLLVFMRLTVMISDALLVFGVARYCAATKSGCMSSEKRSAAYALVLLAPGLLLVDHVHFQYNGALLGVFLLFCAALRRDQSMHAVALFTLLLLAKHLFLYAAPLVGVYLVRHLIDEGGVRRLLSAIILSLSIVAFLLTPLVLSEWRQHRYHSPLFDAALTQIHAIVRRLFPFTERALTHAYWAPNAWALYNALELVLTRVVRARGASALTSGLVGGSDAHQPVLWRVRPLHTILLTLLACSPQLWAAACARLDARRVVSATLRCVLVSIVFGWHVHEKATLLVVVPLALLVALDDDNNNLLSASTARRAWLLLSAASSVALWPLLPGAAVWPAKLTITVAYHVYAAHLLTIELGRLDLLYYVLLVASQLVAVVIAPLYLPTLPFLPLLLTSCVCAIGVVGVCFFYIIAAQRKRKKGGKKEV